MSQPEKLTGLPAGFGNVVRLFPLPNLVMFPHVVQPLHIFEPRYCDLLEEALASDKLITMVLLQPGWEEQYAGRPALEEVACIGRVVSHARLPDSRHNLLLLGLARARIAYELPVNAAFRRARVEVLNDESEPTMDDERADMRSQIVRLFRQLAPRGKELDEQLDQLLQQELELGVLADIVAFTTTLELQLKQRLLAETSVERRTAALIAALQEAVRRPELHLDASRSDYLPPFSVN